MTDGGPVIYQQTRLTKTERNSRYINFVPWCRTRKQMERHGWQARMIRESCRSAGCQTTRLGWTAADLQYLKRRYVHRRSAPERPELAVLNWKKRYRNFHSACRSSKQAWPATRRCMENITQPLMTSWNWIWRIFGTIQCWRIWSWLSWHEDYADEGEYGRSKRMKRKTMTSEQIFNAIISEISSIGSM